MKKEADRLLRWLYCLTLITAIFPSGFLGAAGWVGLAFGGGLFSGSVFVAVIILAIFTYRIVLVVRNPYTLDAYVTSSGIKLLRNFAIFLMIIGLFGLFSLFFTRSITMGIWGQPGNYGIAFFVINIIMNIISSAGLLGLLIFEASRLFGFEARYEVENNNANKPQSITQGISQ